MTSPIAIETTAVVITPKNRNRNSIRFQNTGKKDIYIKKIPLSGSFTIVSPSDYEIVLAAATGSADSGEEFITNSIASFMAVSSNPGSTIAVYETIKA